MVPLGHSNSYRGMSYFLKPGLPGVDDRWIGIHIDGRHRDFHASHVRTDKWSCQKERETGESTLYFLHIVPPLSENEK